MPTRNLRVWELRREMSFAVLRGREAIILFKNTIKGTRTSKACIHGDFKQRLIAFKHGACSVLAAQGIDKCARWTAKRFIEQMRKTAFAVTKLLCQRLHGQIGLIVFLQENEHVLHLCHVDVVLLCGKADIADEQAL